MKWNRIKDMSDCGQRIHLKDLHTEQPLTDYIQPVRPVQQSKDIKARTQYMRKAFGMSPSRMDLPAYREIRQRGE